jgi:diaminohydroxyphosphoribosylaminopyrimidine deaminase/5-amino-6-(5-phosphoribosylamino)uracil reductase
MFFTGTDLAADLEELQRRGIRSLFIEGGPTLASAFIAAGLVDELLVYVAPALLGGPRLALGDLGISSIDAAQRFRFTDIERLGDDVLLVAHPVPSAAPRASTSTDERN